MAFLRLKTKRKFDLAMEKKATMQALLIDVWWEQCVGLHFLLGFRMTLTKPYVELYGNLLDNLRAMNQAIQFERYERLQIACMSVLSRDMYLVQQQSTALLHEISTVLHENTTTTRLNLKATIARLETQLDLVLKNFQTTQTNCLLETNHAIDQVVPRQENAQSAATTSAFTAKDMEGNIPLGLFLFSMQSLCATMLEFHTTFNQKDHMTVRP